MRRPLDQPFGYGWYTAKTCQVCGVVFYTLRSDTKTCGDRCRKAASRMVARSTARAAAAAAALAPPAKPKKGKAAKRSQVNPLGGKTAKRDAIQRRKPASPNRKGAKQK